MSDITLDDIVSLWEVAQNLGVPKNRVDRWAERKNSNGFPEPLKTLHAIRLYNMAEINEWYQLYISTRPKLDYRGWTE